MGNQEEGHESSKKAEPYLLVLFVLLAASLACSLTGIDEVPVDRGPDPRAERR